MNAAHLLLSVLQAAIFFAIGWIVGDVILKAALGPALVRRDPAMAEIRYGLPERGLMAVVGMVVFAVALMLVHIATFGHAFSNPVVVPVGGLVVLLWGRARLPRIRVERAWLVVVGAVFAAVLVAIYVLPALRGGSSVRSGDPPWHLGWTEQLLAGDILPAGPAPEDVARNAYPWGFHAVLATLVRAVPGSTPLAALDALFLVLVASLPLGAAVLARTFDVRSGWAASVAMSLVGGFGWIAARRPEFATTPGDAEFGADLVVASSNSVYELFPPPLPRELGLVMLAAAGFLIVSSSNDRIRTRFMSGAAVGLVGLVSVPMMMSGLLWMTVGALASRRERGRCLWASWVSALVVFGVWALPVVVRYVRFGGFVDITPRLGKEWPLPVALSSWGVLFVGVFVGVVLVRRSERGNILMALGVGTALLLALALARGVFDWRLAGNATLLHQGRVWPPAHLLGAAFAGIAALHAYLWLRARGRAVVATGSALVLSVGIASPVLASLRLGDVMQDGRGGFHYGRTQISDPDSFVQSAARRLGPGDVVRVEGNDDLAFLLFQFSGCRLARFDDPRLEGNDLRIRYRDLAARWDRAVAGAGYEATHVVVPVEDVAAGAAVVGSFAGRRWALYAL